jgi:hypothetical protein
VNVNVRVEGHLASSFRLRLSRGGVHTHAKNQRIRDSASESCDASHPGKRPSGSDLLTRRLLLAVQIQNKKELRCPLEGESARVQSACRYTLF